MNQTSEAINLAIMDNELASTDWELWNLAEELYWWVHVFSAHFFRDQPVPLPVLTFERSRVNNLGHYALGRNSFAVKEQINLNRLYLNRPLWSVLATLIHELTHEFEYQWVPENKRTRSWYHSKAFRVKMEEFGIYCANNGAHVGLNPKGNFVLLLKQHGVTFEEIPDFSPAKGKKMVPIDPKPKAKGKSKLKKWTCGCQIVRVGKREFCATCDICGSKFKLDE